MNQDTAKIITLEQAQVRRTPLLISWKKAAGLLKSKQKMLETHVKRVRAEWNSVAK